MLSRLPVAVVAVVAVVAGCMAVGGCAANPFKKADSVPISLEPPPGVAAPAHTMQQVPPDVTMPAPPSYAGLDSRDLETALSRSRQESQVMHDEIAALREQLASTSTQLAQERSAARPAPAAEAKAHATPAVVMESALGQLALAGVEKRFDGGVVRIEISADKLFESGTANILPGGAALLTQTAAEIERVYPGHFIGIEGHLDTEPPADTSWTSPHQLTAARATSVFDFFTARTSLTPRQLFIVSHGANHPVVSNATAAGRVRNRRIELVIYAEQVGDDGAHPASRDGPAATGAPPAWHSSAS